VAARSSSPSGPGSHPGQPTTTGKHPKPELEGEMFLLKMTADVLLFNIFSIFNIDCFAAS
jgi:hypothetical protein